MDREHAARHKVLDEEAKATTQWLRQALTVFGTRLQQQVRRKDLEEQANNEEQRSRNRAEQAIWEVQNKQLEKETTKLKEQQEELVTAARRLMERSSGLLATFEQRMEEVKMVLGKILLPLTVGQRPIQELRSRVEVLPTHDQIRGYFTQQTERAHRCTGAKWPRTPHTHNNTPSGHTSEQEPSGPGHRTRNTTHRAGTPVNRSQVAQDTAHAKQHTERAHW